MKSDKVITSSIITPSIDLNSSSNSLNNTETNIELYSSSSNTDIDCIHNNKKGKDEFRTFKNDNNKWS